MQERVTDFFNLMPGDKYMQDIEVCISHAALHCMNDTRYGNELVKEFKTYKFPKRLIEVCPRIRHVIVSVSVNVKDNLVNNNVYLSNDNFIASFTNVGFQLKQTLYDKKCLSSNQYKEGERITEKFPLDYCLNHMYVVGNYHFERVI